MDLTLEFEREEITLSLKEFLEQAKSFHNEDSKIPFKNWHTDVSAFLTESFTDNSVVENFQYEASLRGASVWYGEMTEEEKISSYDLPKARKFIRLLLRELENPLLMEKVPASHRQSTPVHSDKVFIVHGHDEAVREKLERLLEKFGLDPIVINKKPNQGQTIIEKIEKYGDVYFAVVLFTPDDLGGTKSDVGNQKFEPRPRQNVILELGYFWGKLGRDRVCLLNSVGSELSSDLKGLGYTALDSAGAWKMELAKELNAAGYKIDASALLS